MRSRLCRLLLLTVGLSLFGGAAPALAADGPAITFDGTARPTAADQLFRFGVSDDTGIARFSVRSDHPAWTGGVDLDDAVFCGSEGCVKSASPNASAANLAAGPHALEVTAIDVAGNATTATFDVMVDPSPPEVRALEFSRRPTSSEALLSFAVDDFDGSGLASVEISADQSDWTDARRYDASNRPGFACGVEVRCERQISPNLSVKNLTDGPHVITVRATDANGQTATGTYPIFVDRRAPEVRLVKPNRRAVKADDSLAFYFDDHGGSGLTNVDIDTDQADWEGTRSFDTGDFTDWNCELTTRCASTASPVVRVGNLANGTHLIRVRVTDANNNSLNDSFSLHVDKAAPRIVPTNLPWRLRSDPDLMDFRIDDEGGIGLTNVDIWSDQASWNGGTSLDGNNYAPFRCDECPTVSTPRASVGNLSAGPHAIYVRATDRWNHTRFETFQICVNCPDPYPTSARFGRENGRIDTDDERGATVIALSQLPDSEVRTFVDGIRPSEVPGIQSFVAASLDPDADTFTDAELGPIEPLTASDLAPLDATPAQVAAASYGDFGCRWTHDRKHKHMLRIALPATPPSGKDVIRLYTSHMKTKFCWNKIAHKAARPGDGEDIRQIEINFPLWAEALGYDDEVIGKDDGGVSEQRPWNGYPKGELAMSRWFNIRYCALNVPIGCVTIQHMYHATYAHYDGTATARMRRR